MAFMRHLQLSGLDWDQVRVFLAVARAGQLASAAERLGLDISTVSRRLDRLEADLGLHLFDRSRGGSALTAAAEALLPSAEDMERSLAAFTAAADTAEALPQGVVRLTAPPGLADAFIAPLLAPFHTRYPLVQVELDASVAYADLTRREADLAIRVARPRSGDLVMTKIVSTRSLPMTSPEYARALGRLRRIDDARWITWGSELSHLPSGAWLKVHAPAVVPVLRTNHYQSQLRAAEAGLGVLLCSEPFRHVRRLVPIEPSKTLRPAWDALPGEALWLVGHRALRTVPRISALWDFMLEHLAHPERATELAVPR